MDPASTSPSEAPNGSASPTAASDPETARSTGVKRPLEAATEGAVVERLQVIKSRHSLLAEKRQAEQRESELARAAEAAKEQQRRAQASAKRRKSASEDAASGKSRAKTVSVLPEELRDVRRLCYSLCDSAAGAQLEQGPVDAAGKRLTKAVLGFKQKQILNGKVSESPYVIS